jgi:hypothetical protein
VTSSARPNCCDRCGQSLAGRSTYLLGAEQRCLSCALRYRPMLKRSALTSLVVGTALVLINQGAVLVSGVLPASLLWQIPLTYLVPFCVATWGALGNSRRSSI